MCFFAVDSFTWSRTWSNFLELSFHLVAPTWPDRRRRRRKSRTREEIAWKWIFFIFILIHCHLLRASIWSPSPITMPHMRIWPQSKVQEHHFYFSQQLSLKWRWFLCSPASSVCLLPMRMYKAKSRQGVINHGEEWKFVVILTKCTAPMRMTPVRSSRHRKKSWRRGRR